MGLFSSNKTILTSYISFYNDSQALVEIVFDESKEDEKEADLVQLVALYYAKMLFNLGNQEVSTTLIIAIQKTTQEILDTLDTNHKINRPNILSTDQIIDEDLDQPIVMTYSGEILEKSDGSRIIQTKMGWGRERFFPPMSVLYLVQNLINTLSDLGVVFLALTLKGMNYYYTEMNSYTNFKSLVEAPNFGLKSPLSILNDEK